MRAHTNEWIGNAFFFILWLMFTASLQTLMLWWLLLSCVLLWNTDTACHWHILMISIQKEKKRKARERARAQKYTKKKIRTEYGNVKGMPILRKKCFFQQKQQPDNEKEEGKKAQYRLCSWEKAQLEKEIQEANGSKPCARFANFRS